MKHENLEDKKDCSGKLNLNECAYFHGLFLVSKITDHVIIMFPITHANDLERLRIV